jgi:hypothetical protein
MPHMPQKGEDQKRSHMTSNRKKRKKKKRKNRKKRGRGRLIIMGEQQEMAG